MTITIVQQPRGSRLCGQACIATLLRWNLERAIEAVGHRRGTGIKELARVLNAHGVKCDYKLTRTNSNPLGPRFPNFAILRYHYGRPSRGSHWVVLSSGWIYDPEHERPYLMGIDYVDIIYHDAVRVTSYAKLERIKQ